MQALFIMRLQIRRQILSLARFNSCTHEGCDNGMRSKGWFPPRFNPRTPKGATYTTPRTHRNDRFQSTHPRRVRPDSGGLRILSKTFQSTHPWRVRLFFEVGGHDGDSFNPRTHEGCDMWWGTEMINVQVSIHASRKGCDLRLHTSC